jgi:hypothetical protein
MILTAVGVYRGVVMVGGANQAPPVGEFRRTMERQRPQMLASAMGTNTALMAAAYVTLRDEELAHYLRFLHSRAGQRWVAVANTAMINAMEQSAQEFGSKLVQTGPQSKPATAL